MAPSFESVDKINAHDGILNLCDRGMLSIIESIFSSLDCDDLCNAVCASNSWINVFRNKRWINQYERARKVHEAVVKLLYQRRKHIINKHYRKFLNLFGHDEMDNLLKRLAMIDYNSLSIATNAKKLRCVGDFIQFQVKLELPAHLLPISDDLPTYDTAYEFANHFVIHTEHETENTVFLFNKRSFELENAMSCGKLITDIRASSDDSYLVFVIESNRLGVWDLITFKFTVFFVTPTVTTDETCLEVHPRPNFIFAYNSLPSLSHPLEFHIVKFIRENGSLHLEMKTLDLSEKLSTWDPLYTSISVVELCNDENAVRVSVTANCRKGNYAEWKVGFFSFTLDSSSADSLVMLDQHEQIFNYAQDCKSFDHFGNMLYKRLCFDEFIIINNMHYAEIEVWSLKHKRLAHRFCNNGYTRLFKMLCSHSFTFEVVKGHLFAVDGSRRGPLLCWRLETNFVENLKSDLKAGVDRCTEVSYYLHNPYFPPLSTYNMFSNYVCNKNSISRCYVTSIGSSSKNQKKQLCLTIEKTLASLK